jgi:hypothetical protein
MHIFGRNSRESCKWFIIRQGQIHCDHEYGSVGGQNNNPMLGNYGRVWVRDSTSTSDLPANAEDLLRHLRGLHHEDHSFSTPMASPPSRWPRLHPDGHASVASYARGSLCRLPRCLKDCGSPAMPSLLSVQSVLKGPRPDEMPIMQSND